MDEDDLTKINDNDEPDDFGFAGNDSAADDGSKDDNEPKVVDEDEKGFEANIAFDPNELASGFSAPFTLSLKITDGKNRGTLIKALVDCWTKIAEKFPDDSKKSEQFKIWCCRVFNMSEHAFTNKEALERELSSRQDSIEAVLNASPTSDFESNDHRNDDLSLEV